MHTLLGAIAVLETSKLKKLSTQIEIELSNRKAVEEIVNQETSTLVAKALAILDQRKISNESQTKKS